MGNLTQNIAGSFGAIKALMSPAFDKMADSHISSKGNSSLTLTEAINQNAPAVAVAQQVPTAQAVQMAMPQGRLLETSRDFSYLDGSTMHFEQEAPKQEIEITDDMIKNSKLPDFLKESFLEVKPQSINEAESTVDLFAQQIMKQMGGNVAAQSGMNKQRAMMTEDKKNIQKPQTQAASYAQNFDSEEPELEDGEIRELIQEAVHDEISALHKQLQKDMCTIANQMIDNIRIMMGISGKAKK